MKEQQSPETEDSYRLSTDEWDRLIPFQVSAKAQVAAVQVDGSLLVVSCRDKSHSHNIITAFYCGNEIVCPLCQNVVTFWNHIPTEVYCLTTWLKWTHLTRGEAAAEEQRRQMYMNNEHLLTGESEAANAKA